MKFLYIGIILIFFTSCQDNEVKIPINDNPGIHEIWDNSRIYILFEEKNGDTLAGLKLGQAITTTHWLTAVDKRLKMKFLTKEINKIIKKRHKKSVHSKEGTHAYFAYLDSTQKKVAFIDFDSIQLMPEYFTSTSYFQEYPRADKDFNKYHLKISPNKIILNDSIDLSQLNKMQIHDSIWKIIGSQTGKQANRLYLNIDRNIYFDRFLDYYTFFKNNPVPKGKLSSKIFIFTP